MIQFDQAKKLMEELKLAADSYYNQAISIITDAEYDQKKDRLVALYEKVLIPKKSFDLNLVKEVEELLNQIGAPVTSTEWKKAAHKIPMSSLDKVNLNDEFLSWTKKINDKLYMVMEKLDGISIDLQYENGKLVDAITRGDGIIGESVFSNVVKMKNVKININDFSGSLRGEIILFFKDFQDINEICEKKNEKTFSNPRNSASGLSKRLDGTFSEKLTILYYDIKHDNYSFSSELEKMDYISNQLNLKTCFYKSTSYQDVISVYDEYVKSKRSELSYEIDGLVISANDLNVQENFGVSASTNPIAKIAWKFPPITKITKVLDIEWNVGNNRRITPVAILEPVMMGVEVRRVTLHNVDIFKSFGLYKNCKVLMKRAGDVIPYLVKVIKEE